MGPATHTGLGAISMKEDYVQGAPLFLHTQLRTLYHGGGQGLPSTTVFARGLSLPVAVVWGTKNPRGAKG